MLRRWWPSTTSPHADNTCQPYPLKCVSVKNSWHHTILRMHTFSDTVIASFFNSPRWPDNLMTPSMKQHWSHAPRGWIDNHKRSNPKTESFTRWTHHMLRRRQWTSANRQTRNSFNGQVLVGCVSRVYLRIAVQSTGQGTLIIEYNVHLVFFYFQHHCWCQNRKFRALDHFKNACRGVHNTESEQLRIHSFVHTSKLWHSVCPAAKHLHLHSCDSWQSGIGFLRHPCFWLVCP